MDENSVDQAAKRAIEDFEQDNIVAYQEIMPDAWIACASDFILEKCAEAV